MSQTSPLYVRVVACQDLQSKFDEASCFIIARCQDQIRRTKVVEKTNAPVYEEAFIFNVHNISEAVLTFELWDLRGSGTNIQNNLGQLNICLKGLKLDFTTIWHPLSPLVLLDKKRMTKKVKNMQKYIGKIQLAFGVPIHASESINLNQKQTLEELIKNHKENSIDPSAFKAEKLGLSSIPALISDELSDLEVISFNFNQFIEIPSDIGLFDNLRVLKMIGNGLRSINPKISKLKLLEELFLDGNEITSFEKTLAFLPKLETLSLSNNSISELPVEIGYLVKLEKLYLSGNPIKSVNPYIGLCAHLKTFHISCCLLTVLPEEITALGNLTFLDLSYNQIQSLPQYSGRLNSLIYLNLAGNKLTDLPISLGYCTGLARVDYGYDLSENPLKNKDLIKKFSIGTDQVVDYLIKRLKKTPVALPQLKLPRLAPLSLLEAQQQQQASKPSVPSSASTSTLQFPSRGTLTRNKPASSINLREILTPDPLFGKKKNEKNLKQEKEKNEKNLKQEKEKNEKNLKQEKEKNEKNLKQEKEKKEKKQKKENKEKEKKDKEKKEKERKDKEKKEKEKKEKEKKEKGKKENGWVQYATITGVPYWFNPEKHQSTYEKPLSIFEVFEDNLDTGLSSSRTSGTNDRNHNNNNNANNPNDQSGSHKSNSLDENQDKKAVSFNPQAESYSSEVISEPQPKEQKRNSLKKAVSLGTPSPTETNTTLSCGESVTRPVLKDEELQRKLKTLAQWCIDNVDRKIIPILQKIRSETETAKTLEAVFVLGQKTTSIKNDLEKIKTGIHSCGLPLPKPSPPPSEGEKLRKIRITILNALDHTIALMSSLKEAVERANSSQIVVFVNAVKSIVEKM